MKVVIINKSDSTGGAAIVSRRLMEALRQEGVDARMLVCEKLTDSPFVEVAADSRSIKRKFIYERLKIFLANGFSRATLFRIDTGKAGLPLWRNSLVKNADAILLNWVNQGMLSLKGVKKILKLGKPVVWTMHDMWCMTGICHHSGSCNHYEAECGDCPLLGFRSNPKDLSFKIWKKKRKIYNNTKLKRKPAFVAVSTWLKERSQKSSLLRDQKVFVIPNAFRAIDMSSFPLRIDDKVRILFGAARLDDPIKGLSTFKDAIALLKEEYPKMAERLAVTLFGKVKDPKALEGFALPLTNLGMIHGEEEVAKAYHNSDIVVSASSYETLPGTLVEAQAYGCIPVSFKRGGQPDIIDQLSTGYMAPYDSDPSVRARNLLQGIVWAFSIVDNPEKHRKIIERMKESVEKKFSYKEVALKYIDLIRKI